MERVLPDRMAWALIPALGGLAVILWSTPHWLAPLYYALVSLLGWVVLGQGRWRGAARWLRAGRGPVWLRAVTLGYGAVIAEEALVGTLYAMAEGNWPGAWAERVGQFVAFNLLAFTGAIWGLTFAYLRWPGLRPWHFWIAGLWGLFAERTWWLAWQNPIAAAILAPANVTVYAIILAPLMLSLPEGREEGAVPWKIGLVWALMFTLSLPPVAALLALRAAAPAAFPSCEYIGC